MNINQLPDDCLIEILSYLNLNLSNLIQLRQIHSHWNQTVLRILRSKSLKLFGQVYSFLWQSSSVMKLHDNYAGLLDQQFNDVIQFTGDNTDGVALFVELFPNLQVLAFNFPNQILFYPLLLQWSHSLKCLTLMGFCIERFVMFWNITKN